MNSQTIRYSLFFIIILCSNLVFTQKFANLKEFTIQDGLPSNLVYEIAEDKEGYIWITTDRGVAKFNGTSFKLFQTKNGLPGNDTFGLKIDSKNRKWLTGNYNSVYFIDNDSVYKLNNTKHLNRISLELEKNDTLYFKKLYSNYWYYLSKNGNFKATTKPKSFSNDVRHVRYRSKQVKVITEKNRDTIKSIKININNSIEVYDKNKRLNTNLTKQLSSIPINYKNVVQIFEDSYNNIWIINQNNRLFCLRKYDQEFIQISANKIFNDNNIFFSQALRLENSIFFITNTNQLYAYHISLNKLELLKDFKNKKIDNLLIDGNKLIVTALDEVFRFVITDQKILKELPSASFRFLHFDSKEGKEIYTKKRTIIDGKSKKEKTITGNLVFSGIKILEKKNIVAFTNSSIYLTDANLNFIAENNKITNISVINNSKSLILVGTYSNGFFVLNKQLKIIQKIPFDENIKSIGTFDDKNQIYLATDDRIYIYECKNGVFVDKMVLNHFNGLDNYGLNNIDVNRLGQILHCTKNKITLINYDLNKDEINGGIEINKVYNLDSIYNPKNHFILPREQNNLSINSSIKTFDNPLNFELSYSLRHNGNKGKIKKLESSKIDLVELSPGDYEITIFANPINNPENGSKISLNFSVAYYFWETKLFMVALINVIVSIIAIILYLAYKRKKNQIKLKVKIKDLESKSLSLQMSPHFIFNVLNNIQSVMILEGEKIANEYIASFSKLMRITLDVTKSNSISLATEINYLELYLDLEKKRLQNNLQVVFNNSINSIDLKKIKLPSMLFQPIVENAIIHGLNKKKGDKIITFNFFVAHNFLVVEIIDNGVGRNASEKTHKKREIRHISYGTKIIEERIQLFNTYHHKSDFSFEIIDLKDKENRALGTKVKFEIPLYYNYKV